MKIKELSKYGDEKLYWQMVLNPDCNIFIRGKHYKIMTMSRTLVVVELEKTGSDIKITPVSEPLLISRTIVMLSDFSKALVGAISFSLSDVVLTNNGTTPGCLGIGDSLEYSDGTKYKFIKVGKLDVEMGCFVLLIKWPLVINNVESILCWSDRPTYIEDKRCMSLSELEQIVGKQYAELFNVVKYSKGDGLW